MLLNTKLNTDIYSPFIVIIIVCSFVYSVKNCTLDEGLSRKFEYYNK